MIAVNDVHAVREAVGVFKTAEALQNAIDELLSSGFHRAELSLLAREADVVAELGHKYRKTADLADDRSAPRSAYVSVEALGDGEGAVIGALMYVGAGLLMGSGGSCRRYARGDRQRRRAGRQRWRPYRNLACSAPR
jgi:hypothetical protein